MDEQVIPLFGKLLVRNHRKPNYLIPDANALYKLQQRLQACLIPLLRIINLYYGPVFLLAKITTRHLFLRQIIDSFSEYLGKK